MSNHPSTRLRERGSRAATRTGTQTITQTNAGPSIPIPTLRLRAERGERRHIQWAEDVIDNEGMGKKKSKVCCIYHKPKEPGESDSDSDSSSSDGSDNDDEPDLSRAQKTGGPSRGRCRRHEHDCNGERYRSESKGKGKERQASPNAYERQPKQKIKKES